MARNRVQFYIPGMTGGIQALTEKEKQALRLLVGGHDAKSMARHLGLSVHTVNERLRDCRRKLGASSSREAARMLREAEGQTPELLGDEALGDASAPDSAQSFDQAASRGLSRRTGWLIGGFTMTVALALYALTALSGAVDGAAPAPAPVPSAAETAAIDGARQWLALVDAGNWQASYAKTGSAFRKLNSLEGWTKAGQGAHGAMGPATSRELVSIDYSPAPPQGLWTIRFRTSFAKQQNVIETVAMAYEDGDWRVVGLMLD